MPLCLIMTLINSIVLFYSKKDFDRGSEYLTKLVTINPNHVGGFQELARVRVDMFMACTDRDQKTGHRKQSLKGVMDCYEDAISIMTDVSVRNLLLLCSSSCFSPSSCSSCCSISYSCSCFYSSFCIYSCSCSCSFSFSCSCCYCCFYWFILPLSATSYYVSCQIG